MRHQHPARRRCPPRPQDRLRKGRSGNTLRRAPRWVCLRAPARERQTSSVLCRPSTEWRTLLSFAIARKQSVGHDLARGEISGSARLRRGTRIMRHELDAREYKHFLNPERFGGISRHSRKQSLVCRATQFSSPTKEAKSGSSTGRARPPISLPTARHRRIGRVRRSSSELPLHCLINRSVCCSQILEEMR